MTKWLAAVKLRLESCGWRIFLSVPAAFLFLTVCFLYDQSYLESAIIVLDQKFTPFFASYGREVGNSISEEIHSYGSEVGKTTVEEFASEAGNPTSGISTPPLSAPPLSTCNIFDGKWVFDDTYPLYTTCRLAEIDFQCHMNGRPDRSYQKWRWQPHECNIPRFDAQDMLGRLKGKRVVIVGDSMGRTQWESLSCLLLQGVANKSSVEMVQPPITRQKFYTGTRFNDHNVSIDYYRSPFIVPSGQDVPKGSPGRVHCTLKLERMDAAVARKIVDADVLLINTGHWWDKQKTFDVGCYFQEEEKLMLGMSVIDAYEKGLKTITSWVNDHVNFNRTEVFFRSFEPSHWELAMATEPYGSISHPSEYPRASILSAAVGKMRTPATVLNITSLSYYRPDGHVFNWTAHHVMDCAHWCLPGVPDTWNQLLYASLLLRGRGVWGAKT